jgi:hypothetical protein
MPEIPFSRNKIQFYLNDLYLKAYRIHRIESNSITYEIMKTEFAFRTFQTFKDKKCFLPHQQNII